MIKNPLCEERVSMIIVDAIWILMPIKSSESKIFLSVEIMVPTKIPPKKKRLFLFSFVFLQLPCFGL